MKLMLTMPNNAVEAMLKRRGHTVAKKWTESFDALLFPGGPDIMPFLYGERVGDKTHANDFRRDILEIRAYREVPFDFPKIGICRGAQLLHVLNGGSLYQDVDGHTKQHKGYDLLSKKEIELTSTHHQAMRDRRNALVICVALESRTKTCESRATTYPAKRTDWKTADDLEVLYHGESNCLCFQPHPEYNVKECEQYFFDCIDKHVQFGAATSKEEYLGEVHCG